MPVWYRWYMPLCDWSRETHRKKKHGWKIVLNVYLQKRLIAKKPHWLLKKLHCCIYRDTLKRLQGGLLSSGDSKVCEWMYAYPSIDPLCPIVIIVLMSHFAFGNHPLIFLKDYVIRVIKGQYYYMHWKSFLQSIWTNKNNMEYLNYTCTLYFSVHEDNHWRVQLMH